MQAMMMMIEIAFINKSIQVACLKK